MNGVITHVRLDAHLPSAGHGIKALLMTGERIVDVSRAVQKEYRNATKLQQARRVVRLDPCLAPVSSLSIEGF